MRHQLPPVCQGYNLRHSFISTFEQTAGKFVKDDGAKLPHLMEFTEGEALQAIQSCTMLDSKSGFSRAREILRDSGMST